MNDWFIKARMRAVPLLVVQTADQPAALIELSKAVGKQPIIKWDATMGMTPVNTEGQAVLGKALKDLDLKQPATVGFVDAMVVAASLPQHSAVFAMNAHRQLTSNDPLQTAAAVQAVSNLRALYKANWRMLIMLGPAWQVPPEIDQDVIVIQHALPDMAALKGLVTRIYAAGKKSAPNMPAPTPEIVQKAAEALSGLSEFAAEQVASLAITPDGMDLNEAWERKRVVIEQAPGLRVYRGTEKFSDIIGLDSVKKRLSRRLKAKTPVGVVVWLDEVDKVLANVEHDTSGVRMDQLRTLLTEMENNEWEGALFAGMPGGGKSLLGKAFGNEAGVPTIALDLAAMEGSLVGESEHRLRHAMEVIKAVGGGHAYFIATSNNATVMRPELQRRMTGGFFWFDPMTVAERKAAWKYYMQKYDLPNQPLPKDDVWSAAEIRNCSREAWNCSMTLVEAAEFIVPVAQARSDEFDLMRQYANGRYLDASKPGVYAYEKATLEKQVRALDLTDVATAVALSGMKES